MLEFADHPIWKEASDTTEEKLKRLLTAFVGMMPPTP